MVAQINEKQFESEIQKTTPTLFVFGAPWCPDCRKIEPILDILAKDYDGKIQIFKIDTQDNESLKEKLNVRRIPTLIFYKNQQEVGDRLVEPNNKSLIENSINAVLGA